MANSEFKLKAEHIQRQDKTPVTIFYLQGWLEAQSESSLLTAAQDAHKNGTRHLVIHMEDLSMLTSAGIRALQKVYKLFSMTDAGVETMHMKMCSAPPQVCHALSVTGMLSSVPMYENLQSALRSFDQ
ncbi:MAG: STAS domain-containing protein [Flavobacteriales bacterium]|nr:STAS domain-containing protein [Flavobacteriales bacterium]